MKPNETVPLLTTLAPVLAVAPPLLIGGAIIVGLIWLLSDKDETASPTPEQPPPTKTKADLATPSRQLKSTSKRITREDLAEALDYGARSMVLGEAVAALQALGFGKTASYKAFSPDGKFGELLEHTPDGLVEWRG
jgi:hypothetical protein